MKTSILLAAFAVLLLVSTMDAKHSSQDDDDDLELSDKRAMSFLRSASPDGDDDNDSGDGDNDDAGSFETRQAGRNCVRCKFGVVPCCAPNICRKKFLRPDECVEVKTGK